LGVLAGWLIVAIAAIAVLFVLLKIVSKVISTSLRLAIILGSLLVIALSLYVLSILLRDTGLPIP